MSSCSLSVLKKRTDYEKIKVYCTSSERANSEDIVMRFHLDRTTQTGDHGYVHEKIPSMRLYAKQIIKRYLILIKEISEMLQEQR